jgi:nicotinamidase-related amidase
MQGMTLEDVNAALDFKVEVMLPNAVKVANVCRDLNLSMIFIHWGYQFPDAMDLDPVVCAHFRQDLEEDPVRWPHHIGDPDSRPARQFDVRAGEYVIAKTAMDAFPSSNLDPVLRNLGIRNIVSVGGNTGACHGMTVRSARERGYKVMVVEDATVDATESKRRHHIERYGYDYLVDTVTFLGLV